MSNIKKLLDTMELIHYIKISKEKFFVFLIKGENYIREIIPDIIILQSFSIKVLLVIDYAEEDKQAVKQINRKFTDALMEISAMLKKHSISPMPISGTNIAVKIKEQGKYPKIKEIELDTVKYAFANHKIPVVSPIGMDYRGNYHFLDSKELTLYLAKELCPSTIFYISDVDGIYINKKLHQFLTYNQVKEVMGTKFILDERVLDILEYSLNAMDHGIKEISILGHETGSIYKKVLTYDIAGTLISKVNDEKIREADIEDINSIYLLVKNEMDKNNILPISEEEIEESIEDYMVYDIDGSVIAAGKIKRYEGECAEIAKIATYPRYQGGKKAQKLCIELAEKARAKGMKYVFGLTVNPGMMSLFESIGFVATSRENLPKNWQEQYDFSRPSKAFIKYFE